jgi:hypothetical protein
VTRAGTSSGSRPSPVWSAEGRREIPTTSSGVSITCRRGWGGRTKTAGPCRCAGRITIGSKRGTTRKSWRASASTADRSRASFGRTAATRKRRNGFCSGRDKRHDAIHRGSVMRVVGPRDHQCSVCKSVGLWGPSWRWYGSLKGLENGEPIVRVCSRTCADRARALHLVPTSANYERPDDS